MVVLRQVTEPGSICGVKAAGTGRGVERARREVRPHLRPVSSAAVSTFIARFDTDGPGVRLAVKDLIDMEGHVTTAGSPAVAGVSALAERDAACLAGARAAGARIVGRTNLHELALGVSGINPWYGTPVNPIDPERVPGGSSSGSAVAVANAEADVAYGTDSGGSVRIPSACCGTAGLKTTWGRIPLDGVWPLSPSFDTVGPMARDMSGVLTGMQLLEPGFEPAAKSPTRVGRLRVECDPVIDAAIDAALQATGWEVVEVQLPEWDEANFACGLLLVAEAWETDGKLAESTPEKISDSVLERLRMGRDLDTGTVSSARVEAEKWRKRLHEAFGDFELMATPTLTILPPRIVDGEDLLMARCTLPVNLARVPALALPVQTEAELPASLQLIAPEGGEEQLVAAGFALESALRGGS
jgi:amidase